MKTTKTRTAVSVALTVLAAGGFLAGFYYYSNRNISSQAVSSCDYNKIIEIVKENNEEIKNIIDDKFRNFRCLGECGENKDKNENTENKNIDLNIRSFNSPSSVTNHMTFYFNFRIANNGSDPSGPFLVTVSTTGSGIIVQREVENINPGEVKYFREMWKSPRCAIHSSLKVVLTVDSSNQVSEFNEDNNIYERWIDCL